VFRHYVLPTLFGISTLVVLAFIGTAAANRVVFEAANGLGALCTGTENPQPPNSQPLLIETNAFCRGTGIALEKGVRYEVSVEMVGAFDGDTDTMPVTKPGGFTAGSAPTGRLKAIFTLFAPFRRALSANWFVPVARVGAAGFEQHLLTEGVNTFTARNGDELFLFVNDAIAPVGVAPRAFGWDSYYLNNGGMLRVSVKKAAAD
jgi:hypothetical protein